MGRWYEVWRWNRVFRNVGIYNSDAGELRKRKHNIYLNVILPSTLKFPKWSPSFVFLLKLSVNFASISLPRTSHTCNFKDQTLWEVGWPRNSTPYVQPQFSFLCSMIISWATLIQISPSQYLRSILILSFIYNYIIQVSSPQDSWLKLHVHFLSRRKGFWGVLSSLSKPITYCHKNHASRWMGEWMDEYNISSGVPRNFVRREGRFNKFSWGQREQGSGGGSPPRQGFWRQL